MTKFVILYTFIICILVAMTSIQPRACIILLFFIIGIMHRLRINELFFFVLIYILLLDDQLYILSANELSLDSILDKCNTKIQFIQWSLDQNPSLQQLLKYESSLHQLDKMLSGLSNTTDAQLLKIESLRSMIHELHVKISVLSVNAKE